MKLKTKDDYIFVSLLITSIIIIFFVLLYKYIFNNSFSISSCFFYEHLGIYCPGCGCTRAFLSLLNFDFALSLYYNPVVLYCAIIVILYFITQTIDRIFKHSKYLMPYSNWYGYVGIFIMIAHCVYKNLFWL